MWIQTLVKPTIISTDSSLIVTFLDGLSFSVVVATILEWLPAIAALASIVWSVIRIYETKTVQGWLQHRKSKREITP